ncbi:hypothetical protein SYNPS1DRAFT_26761 [Syncephalis pseudoplumigaleata]|uniref:Protein kinase domain-containing protein n=1 Tax=Syncephalis pseudoplumigaleata TaxID=1712513 RepID=A0A4P9Z4T0_9FUNG|nr:hypothetical protein SYNPS1DRAFT_26761 [Syncephalis pseudoplumigaleata]|eukprot:RKP27597.1 hypothetical protein SYNPS1DRAFT_26761 [Syncephalis pseudoplumigaleata]
MMHKSLLVALVASACSLLIHRADGGQTSANGLVADDDSAAASHGKPNAMSLSHIMNEDEIEPKHAMPSSNGKQKARAAGGKAARARASFITQRMVMVQGTDEKSVYMARIANMLANQKYKNKHLWKSVGVDLIPDQPPLRPDRSIAVHSSDEDGDTIIDITGDYTFTKLRWKDSHLLASNNVAIDQYMNRYWVRCHKDIKNYNAELRFYHYVRAMKRKKPELVERLSAFLMEPLANARKSNGSMGCIVFERTAEYVELRSYSNDDISVEKATTLPFIIAKLVTAAAILSEMGIARIGFNFRQVFITSYKEKKQFGIKLVDFSKTIINYANNAGMAGSSVGRPLDDKRAFFQKSLLDSTMQIGHLVYAAYFYADGAPKEKYKIANNFLKRTQRYSDPATMKTYYDAAVSLYDLRRDRLFVLIETLYTSSSLPLTLEGVDEMNELRAVMSLYADKPRMLHGITGIPM